MIVGTTQNIDQVRPTTPNKHPFLPACSALGPKLLVLSRSAMTNGWPFIFADDPPCVDETWDPTQYGQTDVDEDIGATTALQEDCQRGDKNGDEVVDHIGRG